jgi:LysM repeat protein
VDKVIFKEYTVMQGDSLYRIALANNSAIELMALHGISSTALVPGNIIPRLPYANPAYCPGYTAYVVRDHDTVFSIARTRGTTVATIAQLNRLDANYTIYAADVICVP